MASTWVVVGYCLCLILPPTCGPEARPSHYPSGLELWLFPSTSGLQLRSGLSEPQTPQPGLRGQGLCPSDSSSRGERSRPGNHSPVSRWSLFTPQGWELRQKTGGSWEGLQEEEGSIIPGGVGFLGGHSLGILEEVKGLWLSPKPETREWSASGHLPACELSARPIISTPPTWVQASLVAQLVKNSPAMWETWV